jgi:hypothetical protein
MFTGLNSHTRDFYVKSLRRLIDSGIPFQVGGAYALARYTGIERHTKDLDLFVKPADAPRVLLLFSEAGHQADMTYPHWLGKVYEGDAFLDIIFRSGNGLAEVDDEWLGHGEPDEVLGVPVALTPVEEMIWSKAFVMERERFDGADVAHLIRARGDRVDWARLVRRFGPHWRVLLCHLILFGYVYPGERSKVPARVEGELVRRLGDEAVRASPAAGRVCQGPFLSREQYLTDLSAWGYQDARLARGAMSPQDVAHWTAAIGRGK